MLKNFSLIEKVLAVLLILAISFAIFFKVSGDRALAKQEEECSGMAEALSLKTLEFEDAKSKLVSSQGKEEIREIFREGPIQERVVIKELPSETVYRDPVIVRISETGLGKMPIPGKPRSSGRFFVGGGYGSEESAMGILGVDLTSSVSIFVSPVYSKPTDRWETFGGFMVRF